MLPKWKACDCPLVSREEFPIAKEITTVIVAALLGLSGLVFVAPTASAHKCKAEDPANDCGPCTDRWYEDDHDHDYNNGLPYCTSGFYCGDVQSVTYAIARLPTDC